jgi:hypothetical protein
MNFENFLGSNDLSDEDEYDLKRGGKNGNGFPKRRRPSYDELEDAPNNDQSRAGSFRNAQSPDLNKINDQLQNIAWD